MPLMFPDTVFWMVLGQFMELSLFQSFLFPLIRDRKFMPEPNKPSRWETNRFYSIWRNAYARFLKIRGEPREIALGFSLGLFIGMSPTMGFQIVIAVFLATLLKWNKISAALAVWITNPITAPFIYGATYLLGSKMLGLNKYQAISENISSGASLVTMVKKTPEIIGAMTVGGFIIGIPLALIGYYLAYSALDKYQEDIKRKLAEQRVKHAIKAERRRQKKGKKKKRKPQ